MRAEPSSILSSSLLRESVLGTRTRRSGTLALERQEDLTKLFFALRDKETPSKVGAGFQLRSGRTTRARDEASSHPTGEDVPGLSEFLELHSASRDSLAQLQLTVAPLSPTPSSSSSPNVVEEDAESLPHTIEATPEPVSPSKEDAEDVEMNDAPPPASSTKLDGSIVEVGSTPLEASRLAVEEPSASKPKPPSTADAPTPSALPTASTSAIPYAPTLDAPLPPPTFPASRTTIFADNNPGFPIPEIDAHYVDLLPELPSDVFRNRLNTSVRRKGKEKASATGAPDLYKMHIKAVHTGAKNFLGRGKRVHNILSTHDWTVALEESRAMRAFERIEQLKADKAWSFRQPKKQKAGVAPKAHWDHVLDEMRWMQTDFRQEKRWKVATALHIVQAVKDWHLAPTSEARAALCVRVSAPNSLPKDSDASMALLPTEAVVPSAPALRRSSRDSAMGMDVDAAGEDDADGETEREPTAEVDIDADGDADADGEADDASVVGGAASTSGTVKVSETTKAVEPAQVAQLSESERAHAASLHVQKIINQRTPIFELGPEITLFTPSSSLDPTGDTPSTFSELFPELPLYTEADPSEKRYEESSAVSGRISLVTRLLGSKPLLVSTLQPSKVRTRDGWNPATANLLDDSREVVEPREIPPASCILFAGRKSNKEVAAPDAPPHITSVPDPEARAVSLYWTPDEDALITTLEKQYGSNWNLIASVFNITDARPMTDHRLPWDLFDRWDRLHGPGSRKTLADGTVIQVALPEYRPPADKNGKVTNFEGSKKRLRHATVWDAMRKVQKKRDAVSATQPPGGIPRRVNMHMHESHTFPVRQFYSPLELSNLKVEQDQAKMRLRMQQQQELALRIQNQNLQQQQIQNGGVRYQQPVPQGFPLQQRLPASSLPPGIVAQQQQQQGGVRMNSPNGSPGSLPNVGSSPHLASQSPPIPPGTSNPATSNGLVLGLGAGMNGTNGTSPMASHLAAQYQQQQQQQQQVQRPPPTADELAAYHSRQQAQMQMQMHAQQLAQANAAAQQLAQARAAESRHEA